MLIQFTADFQEFEAGQKADVPPEMACHLIEAGLAKRIALVTGKADKKAESEKKD